MLAQLISTLGFAALRRQAAAAAERAGKRTALYVLAGILWLTAFGFLIAALTVWLAGLLGAVAACAIVAAAFVVVGGVIQISLAMTARRRPRSESNLSAPGLSASGPATGPGSDVGALAVVAIVGWLLGRQMTRK